MFAKFKKYFTIILGAAIAGFGLEFFLVPAHVAAGGVGGLATIIYYLTGIPVSLLILLINIPIFIWGAKNFNLKFILVALLGSVTYSASSAVFSVLRPITDDIILSSVFGGAVLGIGVGLVISAGGSTGGTDIVALILKMRIPHFSVGNLFLIIDSIIIILAGLVFKSWDTILYSALTLVISTYMMDTIIEGVDYAKLVYIISDKHLEISNEISSKLYRGTTVLHGCSYYTMKEKNIILCVIRKIELANLKSLINSIDPEAFIIVSDAKEVHGHGFNKNI